MFLYDPKRPPKMSEMMKNLVGTSGVLVNDTEELDGFFVQGYVDKKGVFCRCELNYSPEGSMVPINILETGLEVPDYNENILNRVINKPGYYHIAGDSARHLPRAKIEDIVYYPEPSVYLGGGNK